MPYAFLEVFAGEAEAHFVVGDMCTVRFDKKFDLITCLFSAIGYLDPAAPKKLMPRLNQALNRARVTEEEVHILRGIARALAAGKK